MANLNESIGHVTEKYFNDDGTMSFVSHHVSQGVYAFPERTTYRKIKYLSDVISSNATDYLNEFLKTNPSLHYNEFIYLESVSVSCGIFELQSVHQSMFRTYYDSVTYNFTLQLNISTKVDRNLIKLKNPDFLNRILNEERYLMEQLDLEPTVFIEEFIFHHPKTKDHIAL